MLPRRRAPAIGLGLALLVLSSTLRTAADQNGTAAPASGPTTIHRYQAKSRIPPSLESIQKHLVPGGDAFPEEKQAEELTGRLQQLASRFRQHPGRASEDADWLLAPAFKGGRLTPTDEVSAGNTPRLEIFESRITAAQLNMDRVAFRKELQALVSDFDSVETAEFLITRIDVKREPDPVVRTVVRFDFAGTAKAGWRAQRVR